MNELENKRPFQWLIHFAAWGVLFGLPFFFTGREAQSVTLESYLRFVIIPLSFMMVFYINTLFLIEKYLFTKKAWTFVLANVLVIAGAMLFVHLMMQYLPDPHIEKPRPHREWQDSFMFFLGNAILYLLVAGLSVAIKMTNSWYKVQADKKEIEKERAEAELKNLKSQLNPHFLFNTLNNIYSLIAFSPDRAQGAVHDLSKLLRYVLYENNQHFVPLEKELDFIRNYVELMRIRLPEQVKLETNITSGDSSGALIAPLLFISLIENAFKHGVSYSKPSFIHIFISPDSEGRMVCDITNSCFPKSEQDKSGSGIGLANLHKRLELLYPDKYVLQYGCEGETYRALLRLTLKEESV
ncbi:MAG: histidine kinase [Parabacteroides sp.]|nr:histidine kinase [Parabacteroides sp.]